jgi:O-antigen ligase
VAQEHSVWGTGVGDVLADAQRWLMQRNEPWQWIHWPHNQYLTALVQFGWLGGLLWLFLLGHSFFHQSQKSWWPILLLALLSFFTDNTLDTQQGVTWLLWMIFLGKKT